MIGIVLDKDIECGKLCQKIQKLIQDYRKTNTTDPSKLLLSISIKPILDITLENKPPLLEYQENREKTQ
jgi:hypothetical protein